MLTAFMIIVAYLSGSVCSAVIICRLAELPDPRQEGSKNPGASNVLRLAGTKYALVVVATDVLKGLLPVLIARLLPLSELALGYIALATVLGHMFPVFFAFKGGKGVATAMGAILGLQFILGVLVMLTWLAVARITRYASLASILSILLMPLYSLYTIGDIAFVFPLFLITIFVLYQHRENINRLIDGSESKLSFFKPTTPPPPKTQEPTAQTTETAEPKATEPEIKKKTDQK